MTIRWHHFDTIDSTNTIALQGISSGKFTQGDVIWADEQTRGKGNGNNHWESEHGKNLTFSLVLTPHFIQPQHQFRITQAISVALHQTLNTLLPKEKCSIKWPNDLYVNNKKIGGILIQNMIKGNSIQATVAGIGLNVNQEIFRSEAPNPVSVIHFTKTNTPLFPLLKDIVARIMQQMKQLEHKPDWPPLNEKYLNALFQKDCWARYADDNGVFEGKITGVDSYGRLQLLDRSHQLRTYAFKEIRFLY